MRPMDTVRCREDREKTPEEDTTTTIGKSRMCMIKCINNFCMDVS